MRGIPALKRRADCATRTSMQRRGTRDRLAGMYAIGQHERSRSLHCREAGLLSERRHMLREDSCTPHAMSLSPGTGIRRVPTALH